MPPTKSWFVWLSGFRGEDLRNQATRNKNFLWWPCLLTDRDKMSNLNRGPSIDPSYQVSVHLIKQFRWRRFLEIVQTETRFAYGNHVWKEMSNLNRGSSIDSSYQLWVHSAKRFQRRRIKCEKLTDNRR